MIEEKITDFRSVGKKKMDRELGRRFFRPSVHESICPISDSPAGEHETMSPLEVLCRNLIENSSGKVYGGKKGYDVAAG